MNPYYDWKDIRAKGELWGTDKAQMIKEKARMIEEQAARQEKLLKFKSGTVRDENNVNDLLINAIEAKLAILEDD